MPTRRHFLKHTAGLVAAASVPIASNSFGNATSRASISSNGVSSIKSAVRREETILRLGGDGDNWHMSWAANDQQFVSLCDGVGWSENPKKLYNNRLFIVSGGPHDSAFHEVSDYPEKTHEPKDLRNGEPAYYGFGTLAIGGRIYQFLSNMFRAVKLIYSPDNGRTWCNQDGSSPVLWELQAHQSPQTMIFFEEPQNAFSLLSVLQMGRDYEFNQDGYVYVYAPNGTAEGTMNELVLFRVPRTEVLNRNAYEFFAGNVSRAKWTRDIEARAVVHTFPRGWVNRTVHPYAWHPSVSYNAPLGIYMMANWGMGCTPNGEWFGKPSYFGLWIAPQPWGPWTQIHEESAWMPGNDPLARAYQPQIAPKWIAADGKSFWLVWTDFQHTSQFWPTIARASDAKTHEEYMKIMTESREYRPYYAFNTQRVDLVVS